MVRILVTGGRDFDDENFLFTTLDQLHHEEYITLVIHGAARGADSLANDWACRAALEDRHSRGASKSTVG